MTYSITFFIKDKMEYFIDMVTVMIIIVITSLRNVRQIVGNMQQSTQIINLCPQPMGVGVGVGWSN